MSQTYPLGNTSISWASQLQRIMTLSTTKAEHVAVTEASKELIWLQELLAELRIKQKRHVLHSDSQSAIHLAKVLAYHAQPKHIYVCYHFIIEMLKDDVLILVKIQGSKNSPDMLTKPVTTKKLELCATLVFLRG